MSNLSSSNVVAQQFEEYSRLAYWIARKWCRRLLYAKAIDFSPDLLAELAQDAVARGFDRFAKRCARQACPKSDLNKWVAQCTYYAARDAVRSKSRFGSVSSSVAIRDDATNRFKRVQLGFVHIDEDEPQDAMEQVRSESVAYPVQQWELEQVAERELPEHLRPTAIHRACGLTQQESATLQGVSVRTIGNRLSQLREYLRPIATD